MGPARAAVPIPNINLASHLITRRDEAAAELSRERALWELLELFFVQPPTAHGTAAEVST